MPHATILYAEDNTLVRLGVALLLEDEGWRVETCADGLSALSRLEGGARYDLLLLDDSLPGATGLEIAARVRRMPHRRDAPVVILSADCLASEARRAGANLCLRKPGGVSSLADAIRRLLDARKAIVEG
jgi:CheY-like chemotaxis protein